MTVLPRGSIAGGGSFLQRLPSVVDTIARTGTGLFVLLALGGCSAGEPASEATVAVIDEDFPDPDVPSTATTRRERADTAGTLSVGDPLA